MGRYVRKQGAHHPVRTIGHTRSPTLSKFSTKLSIITATTSLSQHKFNLKIFPPSLLPPQTKKFFFHRTKLINPHPQFFNNIREFFISKIFFTHITSFTRRNKTYAKNLSQFPRLPRHNTLRNSKASWH